MSYDSDIKKALKTAGFKLVSSNKHFVYENDKGRTVRLHLGSNISDMKYRSVLKDIRSGNVLAGKVAKTIAAPECVWVKDTPKFYRLVAGGALLAYTEYAGPHLWSLTFPSVVINGFPTVAGPFVSLADAQAHAESAL